MFGVCQVFCSVHCSLAVTCWERANFFACVCGVLLCVCLFPMWCPVSGVVLDCMIPDLCLLSYFVVSPDLSLLIHIKQRRRRRFRLKLHI